LFIKASIFWAKYKASSKIGRYPISEVLFITLITAVITFPNPFTRIPMTELIKILVSQCRAGDSTFLCNYERNFTSSTAKILSANAGPGVYTAMWQLCFALIVQVILMVFCSGIKVPSGLLIPSMSIGAITGRIIGIIVEQLTL
jgi:chloride channel 3/4/5